MSLFLIGCAKHGDQSPACSYIGTHELLWNRLVEDNVSVYNCTADGGYVLFVSSNSSLGTYKDTTHKNWPTDYRDNHACEAFAIEDDCFLYAGIVTRP